MCSPCGPMVCYKYEDCGPPKGRAAERGAPTAEENDAEKTGSKENQLKRTKSRELRGGIMYYSCHCIKRNGLQHDCRRTGCGGEPACLVLPDPLCAPSQLARARGLADPAPLAAHLRAQAGTSGNLAESNFGSSGGKRFIVCELKGVIPDGSTAKKEQCCKLPTSLSTQVNKDYSKDKSQDQPSESIFVLDEQKMKAIINNIQNKQLLTTESKKPNPRSQRIETVKEVCTRPGCVHWKPPSPCLWDLPCKADCFEAPPNIQSGRNPLSGSGGSRIPSLPHREAKSGQRMIILNPIE
ncbi:uncharacterized protein LOC126772126 [Nymphalis io]|uniref:uncharacterized protein LOC126772126 n=1 Tax=Inachis io TaxID=171585 RepID=UPI00216A3619|nr:uncharacterized protein LOC126772126 [Nymphalis io]